MYQSCPCRGSRVRYRSIKYNIIYGFLYCQEASMRSVMQPSCIFNVFILYHSQSTGRVGSNTQCPVQNILRHHRTLYVKRSQVQNWNPCLNPKKIKLNKHFDKLYESTSLALAPIQAHMVLPCSAAFFHGPRFQLKWVPGKLSESAWSVLRPTRMKTLQVPEQLLGMNWQRCSQGHLSEAAYLCLWSSCMAFPFWRQFHLF